MTHEEACGALHRAAWYFAFGTRNRATWYAEVDRIITAVEQRAAALERERAEAPVAT